MTIADWVMFLVTLALVVITGYYAWQTRNISEATRESADIARRAADAAERAAASAERQVLSSRRPFLLVTHVGVSTYTESSHKPRGRDRAVPEGLSLNVRNEGLGPIAWLDADLDLGDVPFACKYQNVPNRRLAVGTEVTLRFEADRSSLEPLFGMGAIPECLALAYADALGSRWSQVCPVTVFEDHSSAEVGECAVSSSRETRSEQHSADLS